MDRIILYIFAISTLVTLIVGVVSMAMGNKFNRKYANKIMTLRVIFQTISIMLLAIIAYTKYKK